MTDDFNAKVQRQIDRLQHCSYQAIEAEVAQKRLAWFRHPDRITAHPDRPTPRQAFDLLFFDYMSLSLDELPIVSETETEIMWHSANPCPTLEAVRTLGLDTRTVCRAAYEKSTQAFMSQLDPQLRFLRSYEEIRPYASHCREMIVRVDFEALMRLALEEAQTSRREGNQGYGAVVVLGQRILSRAHDTAMTQCDPNLHAEVNAIRQAVQALGDGNLSGAILFSTCEPCPLCYSLATEANLTTIVYGASLEETTGAASDNSAHSLAMIEIIAGVQHEECLAFYGLTQA
jgi:tRNA(Arg) A34 adenosine deaminase TadA